jgi:hypothetical protein
VRRAAAALATLAIALVGCGDALDEFRDDLRPLEERALTARSVIAVELRTATLGSERDARSLRALNRTLADIFDEIARLDPPDGYDEPFAAYVRANARMVRGLERFAAALESGRARALRRLGRSVVQELGRSQRARLRWLE